MENPQQPFQCPICQENTLYYASKGEHGKETAVVQNQKKVACRKCGLLLSFIDDGTPQNFG